MPVGARGKKPTIAEKTRRVREVYNLLASAASRHDIIQYASKNWDVGDRTADSYIQEARVLIEEDCAMSRPAFLAECLARLRKIEVAAAKKGQLQVATNSIRLQTELVGLNKSA